MEAYLMSKLVDYECKVQSLLSQQQQRLDALDWDAIFHELDEDDDYVFIETPDEVKAIKMFTCANYCDMSPSFNERVNKLSALLASIYSIQKNRLKQEFVKRIGTDDEDYLPFLRCDKCGYFGDNPAEIKNTHECKLTTKCGECGRNCYTKERLKEHQKMCVTKHKCETCGFKTKGDQAWSRHLNSKEHKEKCGITKQEHKCEICNVEFPFASELKRHLFTRLHKRNM